MEEIKMYAIFYPDGNIVRTSLKETKRLCIHSFTLKWKTRYREGYRCKKITIQY